MKALLAMLFAMTLAGQAIAGDCQLASSTCVDSSASKTISGIVVTLAQVGGCWEYQDTYTCIKPEAIDYCAALTTAGCGQIGSTCSDTAFNGTCNTYSKTFQCGTDQGEPSNTLRLSNSYTLLTDAIDAAPAAAMRRTRAAGWRRIPVSIRRRAGVTPVGPRFAWPA
jgi:conjugal transfer mating pair stabilization protein TraN